MLLKLKLRGVKMDAEKDVRRNTFEDASYFEEGKRG